MSALTATPHPAPHSALRRLVARHPVAAFLVMVYTVNIAVVLPPVLTRTDLWPFDQPLSAPLGHIFGVALPAFLVVAAMHGRAGVRDRYIIAWCLEDIAGVAMAQGDPIPAARLLGAAEELRASSGARLLAFDRARYERTVAAARAALEAAAFAAAWAAGRALPLEQAIVEALGIADEATSRTAGVPLLKT